MVKPLGSLFYPARPVLLEPFAYLWPDRLPQVSVLLHYARPPLIRVLLVLKKPLRLSVAAYRTEREEFEKKKRGVYDGIIVLKGIFAV